MVSSFINEEKKYGFLAFTWCIGNRKRPH